uniref:Golgi associated RAB2 interactor protein-like Rab2B-binding domain-containing protein n=1 Tax=Castor canadensis TaxID=51338 RepID=A0A8C0ZYQ0_CASCN
MIPLDLVHLYVHDLYAWRLKLCLVTGRYYYLELDAPDNEVGFLFDRWICLINLLREPTSNWAPRTLHTPPLDVSLATAPASTWHLQDQSHRGLTGEQALPPDCPSSHCSLPIHYQVPNCNFKSQAVGDSMPLVWSQMEQSDVRKRGTGKKSHPDAGYDRSNAEIHVSDKASITIRTIFSIISRTINQGQSSSKATDSEEDTGRGGLIETPLRCISACRPDLTFLGPCGQLDMVLWQQDLQDLMDPESSTLSSSSLSLTPYPPAFYLSSPISHLRSGHKARSMSFRHCQRPPPSWKAPTAPVASWKAPVIMDQSHKVLAVPALSRKAPPLCSPSRKITVVPRSSPKASAILAISQRASAIPGLSRKAPPGLVVPQKTPAVPNSSWKATAIPAPLQKTLSLTQKVTRAPAIPQKATSRPVLKKLPLVLPTPSWKTPSSPSQHKKVLGSPTSQQKGPSGLHVLAATIPGGEVLEQSKPDRKPEPVVFVGTQETKVVETRTQTKSLEQPFTTTKKESKEFVIRKTQVVNLEGLKGKRKSEGRTHRMKEKTSLDTPNMRSKKVEQQKRWVKTQELAIEVPSKEYSRPFSVEGLTLAKLMIMANSKEPADVSLPSWLSMTSHESAMSPMMAFTPSQLSLLERPPVVVREQPESQISVKENTQQWTDRELPWDPEGPSKVPLYSVPTSGSRENANKPHVPIPLPASGWENLSQPPLPASPISRREATARVPPQPLRKPQGPMRILKQHPVATTGSSSNILLPMLLEIKSIRDMASKAEMENKELGNFPPSARYTGLADNI